MGTTLHAIIEEYIPEDIKYGLTATWSELGTWNFGKDYELSAFLFDAIPRIPMVHGWPNDADTSGEREFCDEDRQWCEPAILKVYPNINTRLLAMMSAIEVMERSFVKIRILWYRM